MILQKGEKLLITHRRLFEADMPRYFLGVVLEYEAGIAKVAGHTWVRDPIEGTILSKPDPRTKIIAIASGTLMVYVLPQESDLAQAQFQREGDGNLWLTDGKSLRINLRERA